MRSSGNQIVLHERNDGPQNKKNTTRNTSLKSIAEKENNEVGSILYDVTVSANIIDDLDKVVQRLNNVFVNLSKASDIIKEVIYDYQTNRSSNGNYLRNAINCEKETNLHIANNREKF